MWLRAHVWSRARARGARTRARGTHHYSLAVGVPLPDSRNGVVVRTIPQLRQGPGLEDPLLVRRLLEVHCWCVESIEVHHQ